MLKSKRFVAACAALVMLLIISVFILKRFGGTSGTAAKGSELSKAAACETDVNAGDAGDAKQQKDESPKKPEIIKYNVKEGDTAEAISKMYGVKVSTVTQSNGLSNDSILKIGQELEFPSVDGITYSIKDGETIWSIAATYKVDVNDIVGANSMDSPGMIKIGQKIIIPGADIVKEVKLAGKSSLDSSTVSKTSSKKVASRGWSWPLSGTITSVFGMRWGKEHKGIDIAAPTGTAVRAFMSGRVSYSGWMSGYGELVIIDHGNGLTSYYGHNSKLLVSAGENVDRGEHIANVGSTGDSTGPHSHFEIRKNGVPVNPLLYLR